MGEVSTFAPLVDDASTLPYRSMAKALLALAAVVAASGGNADTASRTTADLATESESVGVPEGDELLLHAEHARRKPKDAKGESRLTMASP